jgi:hypothetical protein
MIKVFITVLICLALIPQLSFSEDFLGAPLPPDGKTEYRDDNRLQMNYEAPYDDIVKFFKNAFESEKHIKFWDRRDETYIEDHEARPWHSVRVAPVGPGATKVTIIRDNWTWIVGTLVIRFVGVFGVLIVLYAAMAISTTIISRTVGGKGRRK